MVENSRIEWTDHTFSPWTGCQKVSPGCDHCYAEGWSKRSGHVEWGPHGERRRTSTANWRQPHVWNRKAEAEGKRARVFCASLADVFDNHRSIPESWRFDLWDLIANTPSLDWLLLTKRPQNIAQYLPTTWQKGYQQPNLWLGTTVENQTEAVRRIPHLLAAPARVRFLSCEPLLGPVDLTELIRQMPVGEHVFSALDCDVDPEDDEWGGATIDWVICGGESGPGARPMHPDWARSLRDQCQAAGVAFHFKQHGEWIGVPDLRDLPNGAGPGFGSFDHCQYDRDHEAVRVGKKVAGRLLDGRTWDEVPG